jgi:hypothetical protein
MVLDGDGEADLRSSFPQFQSGDLGMRVVATRDIKPGDEITISCTAPLLQVTSI